MDLTPLDLKKQEFPHVLRGYDPTRVRRFLDDVAEAWEGLIRGQQEMRGRIQELGETIENYRRMERTINETLLTAQRIAEESRETSLREAEIIRKEAEMEGRRLVDRAENEARGLQEQIRELKVQRDNLFLRLRTLVEEELLRLHSLREAHTSLPAPAGFEVGPGPAAPAERRTVTPPPAGALDLLQRPRGYTEEVATEAEAEAQWAAVHGEEDR
jgi:cell division initiation protein